MFFALISDAWYRSSFWLVFLLMHYILVMSVDYELYVAIFILTFIVDSIIPSVHVRLCSFECVVARQ